MVAFLSIKRANFHNKLKCIYIKHYYFLWNPTFSETNLTLFYESYVMKNYLLTFDIFDFNVTNTSSLGTVVEFKRWLIVEGKINFKSDFSLTWHDSENVPSALIKVYWYNYVLPGFHFVEMKVKCYNEITSLYFNLHFITIFWFLLSTHYFCGKHFPFYRMYIYVNLLLIKKIVFLVKKKSYKISHDEKIMWNQNFFSRKYFLEFIRGDVVNGSLCCAFQVKLVGVLERKIYYFNF